MRKLFYTIVACAAFAFGILGYYECPNFMPVPLYEVTQNAEFYKWQKIHIKAYLEVHKFSLKNPNNSTHLENYSSLWDYERFCLKDCIAGADLELPENLKGNIEISKLINDLAERNGEFNSEKDLYFAEVEIIGEIEKFPACFSSGYMVKPENIKQISPIQFMSDSKFKKLLAENRF